MSDDKTCEADRQAVLFALEQLSETMDAMHQVVDRLRRTVEQAQQSARIAAETAALNKKQKPVTPSAENGRSVAEKNDVPILDAPLILH